MTARAKKYLVEKSYDPKYGARPLRRTIEEYIEDPLSEQVLRGKFTYGTEIKIDLKQDEMAFSGKPKKFQDQPPKETAKKFQSAAK